MYVYAIETENDKHVMFKTEDFSEVMSFIKKLDADMTEAGADIGGTGVLYDTSTKRAAIDEYRWDVSSFDEFLKANEEADYDSSIVSIAKGTTKEQMDRIYKRLTTVREDESKARKVINNIVESQFGIDTESIKWARKAVNWEDVDRYTTKLAPEILSKLKVYQYPTVVAPDKNFNFEPPQYFIYVRGKKRYLINTEGYNYPRYIVRVI